MCAGHYKRYRVYGDPQASKPLIVYAKTGQPYVGCEGYMMIHAPGHPVAEVRGRARYHRVLLFDKHGPAPVPCHWCGRELSWFKPRFDPDRVCGDQLNGDRQDNRIENLVVSCHSCNSKRRNLGNPVNWAGPNHKEL